MKPKELRTTASVLHELGLSYEETLSLIDGVANNLHYAKRLWRKGNGSRLTKLGLALIAFPEPTPISETVGAFVLSLGIIQNRMRKSALHMEDVYNTFQEVNRRILEVRQELV